ncbi:MAG: tyrosine-type recombinase/integrase [Paludibacteraceae bacterium]|nr:tyrosine-type recombinase/integrase [Paludibacteraceae bacterium]
MSILNTHEFTPYVPAVLRKNSHGYVIEYYFYNHLSGEQERRTIKLNRIRARYASMRDFKEYVNIVICKLNLKLAGGWSPIGSTNTREFVPMTQILEQYIKEKQSELAKNTMFAYRSFCDRLSAWIDEKYPMCNCSLFTKVLAINFMEHIWSGESAVKNKTKKCTQKVEHVSERTYNNNLKLGRAFFAWCIEKCYAKENPFDSIKPKRERKKMRTIIPKDIRLKIDAYFASKNPGMRIVCRLVYTSLLRPVEVTRVQVKQILYDRSCIFMTPDKTKNGNQRVGRMDEELSQLLHEHLVGAQSTDYIVSNNSWTYGRSPKNSHAFSIEWDKMRGELGLPREYQLYSLRDSGIHDLLLEGVVDLDVMHAAGHSDLSMTTRYADHLDDELIARINSKAATF